MLAEDSESLFHKGFAERFSSVEATGPRLVRFHLKEPLATFQTDIDFGIVSAARGKGAGPYVRARADLDATRCSTRTRTTPATGRSVPHVEIKFVRDASARLLMLVGGSADLVQNGVRLDLSTTSRDRPRVRLRVGAERAPHVPDDEQRGSAAPRPARPRRRSRSRSIARAIIAAKFGGRAVLATGLLPPGHWAYADDVIALEPRSRRARRRCSTRPAFAIPTAPAPRPRLHLIYKTSSDAFRVSVARVIAAQLAEVGIDVEVRSFEFATFFADVKKGTYQIASMQTSEITEPDFYFMYFHSSRIPRPDNPDGGNRWRYVNARGRPADRGGPSRARPRPPARPSTARSSAMVADDVPIVPLWHEDNVVLSNVDVQGYTISPNARLGGLVTTWKQP